MALESGGSVRRLSILRLVAVSVTGTAPSNLSGNWNSRPQ
jgi:hypothetical protein